MLTISPPPLTHVGTCDCGYPLSAMTETGLLDAARAHSAYAHKPPPTRVDLREWDILVHTRQQP